MRYSTPLPQARRSSRVASPPTKQSSCGTRPDRGSKLFTIGDGFRRPPTERIRSVLYRPDRCCSGAPTPPPTRTRPRASPWVTVRSETPRCVLIHAAHRLDEARRHLVAGSRPGSRRRTHQASRPDPISRTTRAQSCPIPRMTRAHSNPIARARVDLVRTDDREDFSFAGRTCWQRSLLFSVSGGEVPDVPVEHHPSRFQSSCINQPSHPRPLHPIVGGREQAPRFSGCIRHLVHRPSGVSAGAKCSPLQVALASLADFCTKLQTLEKREEDGSHLRGGEEDRPLQPSCYQELSRFSLRPPRAFPL